MPADRDAPLVSALAPLEGVGAGAPSGQPESEQPDLLDCGGPDGAEGPVTQIVERRRGPGRPPGSLNKRTEDLRRYVLSRYRHPVVAAAELYSLPATALAAALDCKPIDAAVLQLKAMQFVAPYIDSEMPKKIAVTGPPRLPEFHLHLNADGTATGPDGRRIDVVELAERAKLAMHQRLIGGEAAGSHGEGSQDDGQVIDNNYIPSA